MLNFANRCKCFALLAVVMSLFVAANAQADQIYVSNFGANSVSVIDSTSNKVTSQIDVGVGPAGIVAVKQKVYVADLGSNQVSVIDSSSNQVVATIPVAPEPFRLAATSDGGKIYVTSYTDNVITVIDTDSNRVVSSFNEGEGPGLIAIAPNGNAFITNYEVGAPYLVIVNTANNTNVSTIDLGYMSGLALTPDGKKIYVARPFTTRVVAFDTSSGAEAGGITSTSFVSAVFIPPDGQSIYMGVGDSNIAVGDLQTNKTASKRIKLGGRVGGMAASADSSRIYAVNKDTSQLAVIDSAVNEIIATVSVGYHPYGVAIVPSPGASSLSSPRVRVKCARKNTGNCKIKLQVVSRKRKPQVEAVSKTVKVKRGQAALVSLQVKPRFQSKLAVARKVLVKELVTVSGQRTVLYKRLKLIH